MSFPTYQGDKAYVLLQSVNGGCTIEVSRRLDLFSIEVLEKAWFQIPPPRKSVLDVSGVKEFTTVSSRGSWPSATVLTTNQFTLRRRTNGISLN